MRPPRLVALTACVGLTVAVNACTFTDDQTEPTVDTTPVTTVPEEQGDQVLTIGLLVPSTDDGAAIGDSIRKAVVAEIDTINQAGGVFDEKVRYRYADEGSDGLTALLDPTADPNADPVDAIVGPTSSLVALRELNQAVKPPNQVVTCSPSATALSLDNFDDKSYFFRTITSDSLLMSAMAKSAQETGRRDIAVAYIDDPYGRGLLGAFQRKIDGGPLVLGDDPVAIPPDRDDLTADVEKLLADDPGVIIILADASVGGRLLTALDAQLSSDSNTTILVNDSVRTARAAIEGLSEPTRERLRAIVPKTTFEVDGISYGPFAAQAVDCVDLIALAAVQADSDARRDIRRQFAAVSLGGQACRSFKACADLIAQGKVIDYKGRSGPVDLSETGEPNRGSFLEVKFESNGFESPEPNTFEAP